jgi:thiamine biosynthesis lipoprotein
VTPRGTLQTRAAGAPPAPLTAPPLTAPKMDRFVHVEHVMGTVMSFDFRAGEPPPAAPERAIAWLHEVDARFSPYRPDSEVSRLADGTLAERDAHPDVRAVLAMCEALRIESGGAFDIRRWSSDGRLDPSGLVKGWAVQRAADELDAAGVRDYALGAGGDIVARGEPDVDRAWRVGIRHPREVERVAAVLAVTDMAVATSATYERGAHIRDPRSARASDDLQSLTVVGPSLAWADAYATTAFVLGLDGLAWVADHTGYGALAITNDDRVIWTPTVEELLVRDLASMTV